jgi:outer membrane immunogenic protein
VNRQLLKVSAAAAGVLIMAEAYAADLPRKAPRFEPLTPVPVTNWTGFYAGANFGYGWANASAASFSGTLDGVIGGGQIGYNWQTGNFVLGVEGDFQGSDQGRSDTGLVGGTSYTVDQSIQWTATLRGRLGYTYAAWLFYVTGGGAWQSYRLSATALGTTVSDDTTKTAWTAGGGAEWMFMPQWSAKFEYLYLESSDSSVTLFGTTFTGHARNNIFRVGVNYHF